MDQSDCGSVEQMWNDALVDSYLGSQWSEKIRTHPSSDLPSQ